MFRQCDPGTHGLYPDVESTTLLGAMFAEPGGNQNTVVEHFVLYTGYLSPRLDSSGTSQHPLVIKAIPLTTLDPDASGTGAGGAVTLHDFLTVMKAKETASGHMYTYILSTCVTSSPVPNP